MSSRHLFTTIINWVFPPLCVHCGREGAWLCVSAASQIDRAPLLDNPLSIAGVDRVIVRGTYDCPPLALVIQKLKYHYWTGLTDVLVGLLAPLQPQLADVGPAIIVPVPLHARRRRERGFNQAQLVSQALSRLTGWPVIDLLKRRRYTTPQAGLPAAERVRNIIGAFSDPGRIANWPPSAILVDDVITTGSTIAECASVLRQHGVKQIIAVALAKG